MTLNLTPTHRLHDLDAHNLVLQKTHTRRTGRHAGRAVWLTLGYHTTLESALRQALDTLTRDAAPPDLPATLAALQAAASAIAAACAKLPARPA